MEEVIGPKLPAVSRSSKGSAQESTRMRPADLSEAMVLLEQLAMARTTIDKCSLHVLLGETAGSLPSVSSR